MEAPDPISLANFYSALLEWPVAQQDENGAAIAVPDSKSFISFQRAEVYTPPVWPAVEGKQQIMLHLDIAVDELSSCVDDAVALGATVAAFQPQDDVRVLLDPAGHPFCLYIDNEP